MLRPWPAMLLLSVALGCAKANPQNGVIPDVEAPRGSPPALDEIPISPVGEDDRQQSLEWAGAGEAKVYGNLDGCPAYSAECYPDSEVVRERAWLEPVVLSVEPPDHSSVMRIYHRYASENPGVFACIEGISPGARELSVTLRCDVGVDSRVVDADIAGCAFADVSVCECIRDRLVGVRAAGVLEASSSVVTYVLRPPGISPRP